MPNVLQNVTKGSFAKGTGLLIVLAGALGLDLTLWGVFGFVLTGIPLWCFGVIAAAGGVLFHLGPMLFGSASIQPPRLKETSAELFLYLRPFELDARSSVQLMVGASVGVLIYLDLLKGLWWPLAFAPLIINISKEQNFQDAFTPLGDFIAFGHPKEWLQPIGASRVYAKGDWHDEIRQLMTKARVVVIRPGKSDSIKWEIEQLKDHVQPERIVFYLQFRGGKKRKQQAYQFFREHLEANFPTKLPEQLGRARFLTFDHAGRPRFVEEANSPSELFHQIFSRSGDVTTDNLRPLLEALNLELPPRPKNLLNNLATVGLWVIALLSLTLVSVVVTFSAIRVLVAITLFLSSKAK